MDVRQLYDEGLAVQLSAITGDQPEEWDRAIRAWRYGGADVEELREMVALSGCTAAEVCEVAEGSMAYVAGQLCDAVRALMDEVRPQWVVRIVRKLSR